MYDLEKYKCNEEEEGGGRSTLAQPRVSINTAWTKDSKCQVSTHDKLVDRARKRGRVQENLSVGRQEANDGVEHVLKVLRQQLVRLVHDQHATLVHDGQALLHQVEYATRRGNDHVHLLLQTQNVLLEVGAARGRHDLAAHVLGDLDADLRGLQGELARGHNDQRLYFVFGGVDALENGYDVGAGLAGAVFGARQNVATRQRDRYARLLNGRRILPALLEDAHQELALETVVLELVAFRRRHVRGLDALVLRGQIQLGLPASFIQPKRFAIRRTEISSAFILGKVRGPKSCLT